MIELFPHQKEAIEKLRSGSILCGGVGSGKSLAALAYYFSKVCGGEIEKDGKPYYSPMTKPLDLYIITTAKKRDSADWERESTHFLLHPIVDSWNNIRKYENVEGAFFIFDEQRVVGSGSWVQSFLKIAGKNKWILLSATPGDTWMDYIPVFVANGFYKNRTQFINRHVIWNRFVKFPKVDRYLEEGRLKYLKKLLLVEMPDKRETTRHYFKIPVTYNKKLYYDVMDSRQNPETGEPFLNITQLVTYIKKINNSDPSRLKAIENIMQDFSRIIIFYNFDYELEILKEFCEKIKWPYAEYNGHKHQEIPECGKWIYLVNYMAGAEGWNCTLTNCIIFYSQNYSYKITEQSCGRIDRINTLYEDLYYYTLISDSPIDFRISQCLERKEKFNENDFAASEGINLKDFEEQS